MKTFQKLLFIGLFFSTPLSVSAQQWQYTGSLNTARHLHTITVLQNGTVLVTGGDDANGNALASCERYDPATAVWTFTPSMGLPRERHTATELPDGRVVIIGGNTSNVYGSVVTGIVEIYDPSSNAWNRDGSLLLARQNHTATLLNDSEIFVCAGYTSTGITNECEIYNVNSHVSTIVAPIILPRHDHAATLVNDGTVLIAGGRTGGSGSDYLSECEMYHPSTNSWSMLPPMIQPREYGLLMHFSDNTVIAAGGRASTASTAPGSEIFDPSAPMWTSTAPILQPCHWPGAAILPGDRLLMTGGIITFDPGDATGLTMNNTATCEWYDKPNQQWYYAPTMNHTRAEHGAVALTQSTNPSLPQEMVLVAGGMIGASDVTNTCETLDIGSNALANYMAHQQSIESVPIQTASDSMKVIYGDNVPVIDLTLAKAENVSTEIISIDGRVAFKNDGMLTSGEHFLSTSQSLPQGTYLIRIIIGSEVLTSKLIVP